MAESAYLAVARVRKPHGLKGDVVVWLLTDDPEAVFQPGRQLVPIDDDGQPVDQPVTIERSRRYQRQWLLKFEGVQDRPGVDGWRDRVFGVDASELRPPADDELYEHEVPGTDVVVKGEVVGTALGLVQAPGGTLLEIEVGERTLLVPFRRPIVKQVDRRRGMIELDPPEGLLEL